MDKLYLTILMESLQKKIRILDQIILADQEQREALEDPNLDPDDFDRIVEKKAEFIDQLEQLDAGFEEVFARVKEELDGNRAAYTEEIQKMKDLISMITERSMKIQVQEQRNKELAGMQFSKARKKIRQVKAGNKAATQYYKNMQQMDAIPPQFLDKKK